MANRIGSEAKSTSRRCFTFVNVATPTAPSTVLPTKFTVAEKHTAGAPPGANYTHPQNANFFLRCKPAGCARMTRVSLAVKLLSCSPLTWNLGESFSAYPYPSVLRAFPRIGKSASCMLPFCHGSAPRGLRRDTNPWGHRRSVETHSKARASRALGFAFHEDPIPSA